MIFLKAYGNGPNILERVHWNGISATGQAAAAAAALSDKFFNRVYQLDDPADLNFERKELNFIYITPQTISNVLFALDVKKDTGLDGLVNTVQKNV